MNEPGPTRLRGLCEGVGRCIWVNHIVILIGAEGEGGSVGWVSQGLINTAPGYKLVRGLSQAPDTTSAPLGP
jgi:hypothetical protein